MSFAISNISPISFQTGSFSLVALSSDGTKGIAGSASNTGLYTTSDSGESWTQSNIIIGNFSSNNPSI